MRGKGTNERIKKIALRKYKELFKSSSDFFMIQFSLNNCIDIVLQHITKLACISLA